MPSHLSLLSHSSGLSLWDGTARIQNGSSHLHAGSQDNPAQMHPQASWGLQPLTSTLFQRFQVVSSWQNSASFIIWNLFYSLLINSQGVNRWDLRIPLGLGFRRNTCMVLTPWWRVARFIYLVVNRAIILWLVIPSCSSLLPCLQERTTGPAAPGAPRSKPACDMPLILGLSFFPCTVTDLSKMIAGVHLSSAVPLPAHFLWTVFKAAIWIL